MGMKSKIAQQAAEIAKDIAKDSKITKQAAEIVKDLVKNSKKTKQAPDADIQIMMLGARRAGKTSMLASMYSSFDTVTKKTNLVMSKQGGIAIDQALDHMKALFKGPTMVNDVAPGVSDFTQTQGFDKIDFILKIAEKKNIKPKTIRYIDCSGEWVNERVNEDEIGAEIEKSEVVIIAVDTVLLMENDGKYNHLNAVQPVTEFIINNMNPEDMINDKKMVLFVPMKCEKYFHQNANKGSIFYNKRMQEITDKIREEYAQLFSFLTKPNNKKHFTVAILPVITLGGIEFDEFTSDRDSDILTDEIQYRYCEPNKFAPRFCDRPLIYSLSFVQKKIHDNYYAKTFDANNGKRKIFAGIKEWFQDRRNLAKDTDYINELNKVVENLSTEDYPGFVMVQDPDGIELKVELRKKG